MPIILAIEPDRRQAAHLAGIVRHRVAAELIIADTTEGALDAIGNRVPDMVLVPALLSPQDDAALAAALRVIAAAAHVRTLTIPLLAIGPKRTTPGGMLAKWRRGRAASPEPEGCDPAVFAEQINAYLQEAAAERAEQEPEPAEMMFEAVAEIRTAPIRDAQPVELVTRDPYEPLMTELLMIKPPVVELLAVAPPAIEPPMVEPLVVEPLMAEPVMAEALMVEAEMAEPLMVEPLIAEAETVEAEVDEPIEPPAAESTDEWTLNLTDEPVFDLSEALDDISTAAGQELFAGDSFGVYTISSPVEEPAVEAFDFLSTVLDPIEARAASQPIEAHAVLQSVEAYAAPQPVQSYAAPQPAEAFAALSAIEQEFEDFVPQPIDARVVAAARAEEGDEAAPRRTDEPRQTDFEPWVYMTPGRMWPPLEGMLAESPTPKAEHLEWTELVASLRQDLERRRNEPQSASVPPVAAAPPEAGEGRGNRPMNKQKDQARKSRAIQDEWGFFDPEQCGFSALLAKLEEITDGLGDSDVRRPS